MKKRSAVRRFPRLLSGKEAAALTRLLWKEPQFQVGVITGKEAIQFTFRVPVPREICRLYPPLWELFFGAGTRHWEKALEVAYLRSKSGDKTGHRYVSEFLHRVYRDAIDVWLEDAWTLANDDQMKQEQLHAFRRQGQIFKRSQPDPWLALQLAERFERLRLVIRDLRVRLKKGPWMNDTKLTQEVQACLSAVILQKALSRIPTGEGKGVWRPLFAPIPDRQITEAYIRCEVEDSRLHLGIPPLRTYIRVGNQVRQALSEVPRA